MAHNNSLELPQIQKSGLRHAIEVLSSVEELSFNFFHSEDVVRHPVVARIVVAYEAWEEQDQQRRDDIARQRAHESNSINSQHSAQQSNT